MRKICSFIYNKFLKTRFWYYRIFKPYNLSNYSSLFKSGRTLTFNDDFNKVSWSTGKESKWLIGESYGLFHENKLAVHYGAPELYGDSYAKFTVKFKQKSFYLNSKSITIPFEASLLSSAYSLKQQYGRFECRCTIPHDRGVWPAFWLWGETWPPEIDVFELYGGKKGRTAAVQELCVHYGNDSEGKKNIGGKKIRVEKRNEKFLDALPQFHEFAVEWTPDKIEFFTDSIKVYEFSDKKILDKWFNVDTAKMQMIINHSIKDHIVKSNEIDYYSEFFVDYIRAYK